MLNIRCILSSDGESLPINYHTKDIEDSDIIITNIAAKGDFRNNAGRLELDLAVLATVKAPCARCLKPIEVPLGFSIQEYFSSEHPIEDDEDANFISDNKFDIDRYIEQSVFLNIPRMLLCSDDCIGLCPICGINLNKSSCTCETNKTDERFAKLQTLIDKGNL